MPTACDSISILTEAQLSQKPCQCRKPQSKSFSTSAILLMLQAELRLSLEPTGGKGSIIIDRISFENESPICTYAGRVSSCTATKDFVTVSGEVDSKFLGNDATIEIRHFTHFGRPLRHSTVSNFCREYLQGENSKLRTSRTADSTGACRT